MRARPCRRLAAVSGWVLSSLMLMALAACQVPAEPETAVTHSSPMSTRQLKATFTPRSLPTATPTNTQTPTATSTPTVTATPVPPAATPTASPSVTPSPSATPSPSPPASTTSQTLSPSTLNLVQARVPRLVLANYFAWYDADGWDDCNISAGDRPLEPYNSDNPGAIARHIQQAREAGIDGFTLNWFAPGDRTDRNLATLLAQSQGQPFVSTVVFLNHIWHGAHPTQESVVAALRYILDTYGSHSNFLKLEGKPVLFFSDVYRVPTAAGQSPQEAWAVIRQQVDPQHQSWWIAEGLDPSYLGVFDGLYVHKITHRAYPDDYLKAPRWAARVREWERRTGRPKLWVATIMPGWDDTRAGCKPDVRVPSDPHRRDREGGSFYRATLDAALQSQPDWLWVNSFNEWVEGTYIEPSILYGDFYLRLTAELVRRFKGE